MMQIHHPNIVNILDAFVYQQKSNQFGIVVMEKAVSIEQMLPMMSAEDVMRILIGVSNALAFLHSQGFIHRDVKPDNIMLMPEG